MIRTEKEIRAHIKVVEKAYKHVLDGSMATIVENAPRALMQLTATSKLDSLYWVIGETRPLYEHEKKDGKDDVRVRSWSIALYPVVAQLSG